MSSYAIACGHRVTADAAEAALGQGGNAVDAAIAGAFAAMVAEPVLAGLLGGGFLTIREPGGRVRVLDFFVQTPRRRRSEEGLDHRAIEARFGTVDQTFHVGAGTIAAPGIAQGLAEARLRYGRLPMPEIAAPAIRAAREGVEVSAFQAELGETVAAILTATPGARALYCEETDDGSRPLPQGATWRNPAFADVLEVFALEGPRFVSEGEVASALLSLTLEGGHLGRDDLADYSIEWRDPVLVSRGGAQVALNPPPAMGGVLIALASGLLPHRPGMVEISAALAATARARIEVAVAGHDRPDALLDPALLERYRAEIAGHRAATRGTTHISVIDRDGLGAALTLSNGAGSGVVVPGTGIMANNMLGEEDLLPAGLDAWTPDQRLSSMMCPMAINWTDGSVAMLGSGGSNRIRSALLQATTQLIDFARPPEEAVATARCHVEGDGDVDFEECGDEETREGMLARWPEARVWSRRSLFFGGVHAVTRSGRGDVSAGGDPRRDGVARTG